MIGILTQTTEWHRLLDEDQEPHTATGSGVISELLGETLPTIVIPENATHEEIARLVAQQVGGAIKQLVGAFALTFAELAQVHDSGRTEVSTADVLRSVALRAEKLDPGGDADPTP